LHVIDTLDPAGISELTAINNMGDENVEVVLPESRPHMLLATLLTTPTGNVIVMVSPIVREDDMLNMNDAAPPAPTAVDTIKPVSAVLKQPTHGLASCFTNKGVSFSKLLAAAKLVML